MNVVKIVLKVKSPAQEYDLDFTEKSEEILEAVNVFNDKFRDWSKRIVVTQVTKRAMHLLLIVEKFNIAENMSVREIRYFIQYLRNEKSWDIYSREKNKMFETVEFFKLDVDILEDELTKVKNASNLYEQQKEDISFLEHLSVAKIFNDASVSVMEDEDLLIVLEFLIKTKDKGMKAKQKVEDLSKVKLLLSKWL